jgi:Integron Cassette Protein Hfx_Cass5
MKEIDVIKVEVLHSGEMIVQPDASDTGLFEYIYRTAAEVHWNKDRQAFVTPKPKTLSYSEWLQIIRGAVASELGVNLKVTERTQLINLPPSWNTGLLRQ